MVLVSTERISATAASDITTSAISVKNSTTPRCLAAGAQYLAGDRNGIS